MPATTMNTTIISLIALAALFYILYSERAYRQLQEHRKRVACRLRQKIQQDINDHRPNIGLRIICEHPIGPIKDFIDWMCGHVGVVPSKERKHIQITVERAALSSTNLVRMTITWPTGKMSQEFAWQQGRQLACVISMRQFMLTTLQFIFASWPSDETLPIMAIKAK